uniref:Uncharacterized protein n=1 Tax=Nelumbo nucifera TaxID=4432 RepID=A0A822YDY3_NELNU|nr:TPA_asm: hypothetical protein HUJ06_029156 [Nelumbo nucifera]
MSILPLRCDAWHIYEFSHCGSDPFVSSSSRFNHFSGKIPASLERMPVTVNFDRGITTSPEKSLRLQLLQIKARPHSSTIPPVDFLDKSTPPLVFCCNCVGARGCVGLRKPLGLP